MGTHPIFESDFDCLTVKMETDDKVVESTIENGAPIASVVAKESFNETVDIETPENPERIENNNLNGNKNDSDSAIFTGPSNDNNTDSIDGEESENEKEVEKILDKRLVEGKEPWYLIKWKDEPEETWVPIDVLKCNALIQEYEESLANLDPDVEYELDEICGKRETDDGEVYYLVKWRDCPESQNTWEPEVNIYAKDKIEEFEKKFKGAKKGRGRKPKVIAEDPDYDNVSDLYHATDPTSMEMNMAIKKTRSGRLSNPPPENYLSETLLPKPPKRGRKPKKTPKKSPRSSGGDLVAEFEEEVVPMIYDDFYEKLEQVRVPPSTYDTSDFDNTFLFHIRMSNYLSWIVLEHHIHHFDILNAGMTRIERRSKLEERLQRTTSLKPQMIDIIMSRENGVWEAILCMNQAQRKLEYEKMRRYLRDNESIPIPANWNIMRFIDTIEKRRRKQFGFEAPLYKSKSPVKKSPAKKRKPYKKRTPKKKPSPKKRKVESDYEEDEEFSEQENEEPDIEKELDAELDKNDEKDDDGVDSDFDAELEEEMEKNIAQSPPPEDIKQRIQSSESTSRDILNEAVMAAHIDSEPMPDNNSPIVEVEVASHSTNNSNSTQNLNSNQQIHPDQNLIESKVKTSENITDLAIKSKNMVVLNPVLQKASRDQSEPESVIQESHLTDRNAAPRDIVLTEVKISEGPFTYSTTNFQS